MKFTKLVLATALGGVLGAVGALAQTNETFTFNSFNGASSLPIPDGDASGVSDIRSVSSAITKIGSMTVTLNIAGNFNGDLYVYLSHGTGFSVLLDRVGRSASHPSGYGDSGMNVTLSDVASADIHTYQTSVTLAPGTPLTGTWQPDARTADPTADLTTFDASPRSDFLSSFNGANANGSWTLYLADLQTGGTSALKSWSLNLSTAPAVVPEPRSEWLLLMAGAGLFGFAKWRRQRA